MFSFTKIESVSDGFYKLSDPSFQNGYFLVSDAGTCRLMASPEVVGFDSYAAMLPSTVKALEQLKSMDRKGLDRVNILTILRGGLNYPLEEACHRSGIMLTDISFMSCERIIRDGVITGLDVKYEQTHTEPDCTLLIGDIIASGATLKLCLKHFVDRFRANGHSIRKIIFFTVGGTKAIGLMEDMTAEIRTFWPDFEGFQCVFYEGCFTVYEDRGVTGVNIPDIDFGWKGGLITPEFRKYVADYTYAPALLEKCIIYDGGARRYKIGEHVEEVTAYWQDLLAVADGADYTAFLEEKIGYSLDTGYEQWLQLNHYEPSARMYGIYASEQDYLACLASQNLREICLARLGQISNDLDKYLDN